MKHLDIVCPVIEADFSELSPAQQELVTAARIAVKGSYAPYSNFHVGAAIRMADGEIIKGANQENAATPSSICAERSAAYWAGANRPGMAMKAIAIAARDERGNEPAQPISPCGACRQALLEYEKLSGGPMEVLLVGADKIYVIPSVKKLVPLAFTDF